MRWNEWLRIAAAVVAVCVTVADAAYLNGGGRGVNLRARLQSLRWKVERRRLRPMPNFAAHAQELLTSDPEERPSDLNLEVEVEELFEKQLTKVQKYHLQRYCKEFANIIRSRNRDSREERIAQLRHSCEEECRQMLQRCVPPCRKERWSVDHCMKELAMDMRQSEKELRSMRRRRKRWLLRLLKSRWTRRILASVLPTLFRLWSQRQLYKSKVREAHLRYTELPPFPLL